MQEPWDAEPIVRGDRARDARVAFRRWRRTRPFWAGVWSILSGTILAYVPATSFKFLLLPGSLLWVGVLVGTLVAVFGVLLWVQPQFRVILGVLIVLLAMVSFITSDFGGFLVGMLTGIIGGSMGAAWVPRRIAETKAG
jgi:uncharacterized protein DUF6114